MRETDGFRLAAASVDGKVGAVAGFRVMEMLYCGKILSVDDLVTGAFIESMHIASMSASRSRRRRHFAVKIGDSA